MKPKGKAKKAIATIFASLLLCSVFAVPVFANSYESYLNFDTTLNGPTRAYEGGTTIGLKMTLYTGGTTAYAHVGLWRHKSWGSSLIGTVDYYEGFANEYWTNVGPGNYNFYFEKYGVTDAASHYAWLTSNDVIMYCK